MNKTKSVQYILVFALAVTLSLSFHVNKAKAAYSCPSFDADTICNNTDGPKSDCDSDFDGFWDDEECSPITLGGISYSMNPTKKDLFLIIVPAGDEDQDESCDGFTSLLPTDLLYPSTNPPSLSGLGLTVHVINNRQDGPNQSITPNQNAIKMSEKCTGSGDAAGEAVPGIPANNALYGAVFTRVIEKKINDACQVGFDCTDGSGNPTTADELIPKHIINSFNHEVGHMLGLSVNWDRKVANHWPVGTGNELDQFVECSSNTRKKTASCSIPVIHSLYDISGFRLK